jgi:hypothetical protein
MSSNTHNFTFTKDPERLATIRENQRLGREREMLPQKQRERMDFDEQHPTKAHLIQLRKNAGLDK